MKTLTDLIKSAEEKLANPDLTLGTRQREEAILHHLTNLERTVTELESQNVELYVDLAGGVDYTVDTLIRHKWPEEKPEWTDDYLVNLPGRKNGERVVMYYSVEWGEWGFRDGNTLITSTHEPDHWWELPEVTE